MTALNNSKSTWIYNDYGIIVPERGQMVVELDDSYIPLIKNKMNEFDTDLFDDADFDLFLQYKYKILGYIVNDEVVSFCCLMKGNGLVYVAYTWSDSTRKGKKGFIAGIDYLIENYPDVKFEDISKANPLYKFYIRRKKCHKQEQ